MILCTYNILESGLGRIDPLAEVIRLSGAQVVVLQECQDATLLRKLAQRLGMEFFHAQNPRNPDGATGVLTPWEFHEAVNYAPLDPRLTRSAFHVVLRQPGAQGRDWTILGLHLHARETLADEALRLKELPAVLEIGERLRAKGQVILAGDFNTSHPQQIIDLEKLRPSARARVQAQGNIVPRDVIARVLAAGWVDAHALGKTPAEFATSFTTSAPATRVDFVFVTPALAPAVQSCDVFKPEMARFASDHFPVVARIG